MQQTRFYPSEANGARRLLTKLVRLGLADHALRPAALLVAQLDREAAAHRTLDALDREG